MTDLSSLDRLLERFPEQTAGTTPLPWSDAGWIGTMGAGAIAGPLGSHIALCNDDTDRAYLALAANGYGALRSALVALRTELDEALVSTCQSC